MTFRKKLCETKGKGSTSLKGWKIHPKDVSVCVCVCILKAAAAAGAAVHVSLKGSHGPRCDTRLSMQDLLFPPCMAPGCHWKDGCWSWNFNTLATWCEELTHWKRPWQWERLKAGGEGDDRGWNGWMASTTRWTWVWAALGVGDGQGSLACCSPWGCKVSDMTEQLNWTDGSR